MPKYRVYGTVKGCKFIGVFEAASAEEAEDLALKSDESSIGLCHHCSKEVEDPEVESYTVEEASDDEECVNESEDEEEEDE